MEETHVVTCFLRNRGDVLLLRRSEDIGSYAGQWSGVAGPAEGNPDDAAREEIREETALADAVTPVRGGDAFAVEDADLDTRWVVHPYLFDCASRDVTPNYETAEYEWVPPTEILRRETVPELWTSYDRVRPGVETVADDREHGSAYLSVRALEVLRDEAALAATGGTDATADDLVTLAGTLREARPSMTVIANRVDRVMHDAMDSDVGTPAAIAEAAETAIGDALDADDTAAETAAERVAGGDLVTLSRSGTVRETLRRADPSSVLVAESRPGGEGVGVAERLAGVGVDVTLAPDAAVAHCLGTGEYDAVLVGADTVLPDGTVLNKVGTRGLALAAAREDVPVYVVCARDKISPEHEPHHERCDPADVYDGDADLDVATDLFDATPPDLVTGVVTEVGVLGKNDVAVVATEHRQRAAWNE
jgi:translation initiation factor 2B subunit (eIF-2B alpha/beta/delta family)/ADP-ribose pyrophosphatase YjhB (NUDIX family)